MKLEDYLRDPKIQARLKHIESGKVKLDNTHDWPYLAGTTGRCGRWAIGFDRHLPKTITVKGRTFDPRKFLRWHEGFERALMDIYGMPYAPAHKLATKFENQKVREAGIDVAAYESALKPYIKADEHEHVTRPSPQIDMRPYQGADKMDRRIRRALRAAMQTGGVVDETDRSEFPMMDQPPVERPNVEVSPSQSMNILGNWLKPYAPPWIGGTASTPSDDAPMAAPTTRVQSSDLPPLPENIPLPRSRPAYSAPPPARPASVPRAPQPVSAPRYDWRQSMQTGGQPSGASPDTALYDPQPWPTASHPDAPPEADTGPGVIGSEISGGLQDIQQGIHTPSVIPMGLAEGAMRIAGAPLAGLAHQVSKASGGLWTPEQLTMATYGAMPRGFVPRPGVPSGEVIPFPQHADAEFDRVVEDDPTQKHAAAEKLARTYEDALREQKGTSGSALFDELHAPGGRRLIDDRARHEELPPGVSFKDMPLRAEGTTGRPKPFLVDEDISGGMQQNPVLKQMMDHLRAEYPDADEQTLRRMVTERGRSGRPTQTTPLPIGIEQDIMRRAIGRTTTPGGAPRVLNPVTVYHGSPHDWREPLVFDPTKVNTGEGAQAYGHAPGGYWAGNPKVAEEYKDKLSRIGTLPSGSKGDIAGYIEGKEFIPGNSNIAWIARGDDPLNRLRQYARGEKNNPYGYADDAAKIVDAMEAGTFKPVPPGKLYEAHLHALPEQFLDWDKPLSEQSPMVQKAIGDIINKYDLRSGFLRSTLNGKMTGEDLARAIEMELVRGGHTVYQSTPEVTSRILAEHGIKGVRYLDQGSRRGASQPYDNLNGKWRVDTPVGYQLFDTLEEAQHLSDLYVRQNPPTYNYAVFDPAIPEVLRKRKRGGKVKRALAAVKH